MGGNRQTTARRIPMAATSNIYFPPLEMAWDVVIIWASMWKRCCSCTLTGRREPNSQSIWNTWLLCEYWATHPRLIQGQSLSLALETTFSKYISQHNNGLYFHFCLCYWERIENHRLIHDHYLYVSIKSGKMLIVRNAAEMPILAFTAGDIHLP